MSSALTPAGGIAFGFLLLAGSVTAAPPPRDEASALFTSTNVPRLRIEISPAGMAELRNSGGGMSGDRPKVSVTVREGNRVYTNVTLHLKGAAGSFRPIDSRPAFTMNFENRAPGQRFHGLEKLSLNNSQQDRSLLSEKICRELFAAADVPVPRAAHAVVELNGRRLGLYVLTEGYNEQFLKRHFKNSKGRLYDGGFLKEISQPLSINSGAERGDDSGLRALIAALRQPDVTQRWADLQNVLDLDRFISFMAMEIIQCHWDGYTMNKNNWRLFHDLGANKMVFLPHGLDQMFGVERVGPDCPIFPRMGGVVARAIVANPEGRRRYVARLSELSTKVFNPERVADRVDVLAAQLQPVIAEFSPEGARRHQQEVEWLKERIRQRGESLKRQLAEAGG